MGKWLTKKGDTIAEEGADKRRELLMALIRGISKIEDYTTGLCYDAAAFVWFLNGELTMKDLEGTSGQNWTTKLGLDSQKLWEGENIPPLSIVAFKRLKPPEYFHMAIAVEETKIRGVNQIHLSPGWKNAVDLKQVLKPVKSTEKGVYMFDGEPVQVRYRVS